MASNSRPYHFLQLSGLVQSILEIGEEGERERKIGGREGDREGEGGGKEGEGDVVERREEVRCKKVM